MSSKLNSNKETIGLLLLVLLMTGAIDNIRNLPLTATSGTYIFFFFGIAIILFLLPVALVSAEMTATYTGKGEEGVYGWVKKAFGPNIAMVAIWFQWINTLIWFPSILTFIAGTVALLINPSLAQNMKYTAVFITITFWALTIINLKGLRVSAIFASACTFFGMVLPMVLIVLFALAWLILGNPIYIHFEHGTLVPSLTSSESWMGLTGIIASFLGLELATVHIRKVRNARKTFPLALLIASVFMVLTMILGALAVSMIFPLDQIDVVNGAVKSFSIFLDTFGLSNFFYILVVMIFIGSLGSMINWIISPARGLLQAADDHFLPEWLDKKNKHDVPSNILILQAIIMTVVCSAITLVPSVQAYYFLLTVISTQIYSMMYMLMFFAAMKLKLQSDNEIIDANFKIPGGKVGMSTICILGILGTTLCVIVGFVPPDNMYASATEFVPKLLACLTITILPVLFFHYYRIKAVKKNNNLC